MPSIDYQHVTELCGEEISAEQLYRMCNRYYWASQYCQGKDVLEVACGSGPGLGLLLKHAKTVRAGDITPAIVERARHHYGERLPISVMDACNTGLPDDSVDAILIFEALYYLPDPALFARECRRILRSGGFVLVSNANKDLFDFSPSPHSNFYHGVVELDALFSDAGFSCEFFGSTPTTRSSWKQRLLRPVKAAVVKLNLMPKTMAGKRFLKRLVFGPPILMPAEITENMVEMEEPAKLGKDQPDRIHKVIYCKATLTN